LPGQFNSGNRFVVHAASPIIQLQLRCGTYMMPHATGIARMIETRVVSLRKDDEQKQNKKKQKMHLKST